MIVASSLFLSILTQYIFLNPLIPFSFYTYLKSSVTQLFLIFFIHCLASISFNILWPPCLIFVMVRCFSLAIFIILCMLLHFFYIFSAVNLGFCSPQFIVYFFSNRMSYFLSLSLYRFNINKNIKNIYGNIDINYIGS